MTKENSFKELIFDQPRLTVNRWTKEIHASNKKEKSMRTNSLYGSGSLIYKMLLSFLGIVLIFATLPVHAALAAPAATSSNNFEQDWSDKLQKVHNNSIFYQSVRVYPANFDDPADLAQAHDSLNQYGVALRAAQRIITNHNGFDPKGRVTNDIQANQSLKDLSENLRIMRVQKSNLDALHGEYILLPLSSVASTTP